MVYNQTMARRKAPELRRENGIRLPINDKEQRDFYGLARAEGIPLTALIRQLLYRRIEERKKEKAA